MWSKTGNSKEMAKREPSESMEQTDFKSGRLSREILGLFGASSAISVFFFAFLHITADSLVLAYCEQQDMILTEPQSWMIGTWIQSISAITAVLLFVFLFLFLMGQKMGYIREIIGGIHALRHHRMDYEIPLEGNNELTELAESINVLSRTERELQRKETQMREDREQLIRTLSHDIRTPLTSILSYSEYIETKETLEEHEIRQYAVLMQQKSLQIKELTDRLLHGGRMLESVEDGRLLMEQLVDEWVTVLEDGFVCQADLTRCPSFAARVDIQELRRIFDNLASNVQKYGDPQRPVTLHVGTEDGRLQIRQANGIRQGGEAVESSGIGLQSIRRIAENYGGTVETSSKDGGFVIAIWLMAVGD